MTAPRIAYQSDDYMAGAGGAGHDKVLRRGDKRRAVAFEGLTVAGVVSLLALAGWCVVLLVAVATGWAAAEIVDLLRGRP